VINMLLEYTYREDTLERACTTCGVWPQLLGRAEAPCCAGYVTEVCQDAQVYSRHAGKSKLVRPATPSRRPTLPSLSSRPWWPLVPEKRRASPGQDPGDIRIAMKLKDSQMTRPSDRDVRLRGTSVAWEAHSSRRWWFAAPACSAGRTPRRRFPARCGNATRASRIRGKAELSPCSPFQNFQLRVAKLPKKKH
jgi:hypothetical protein